jgi:hypothetical protein
MSRIATARSAETVLAGEEIISADSYIMEADDLWAKHLPASLQDKYPDFPKWKTKWRGFPSTFTCGTSTINDSAPRRRCRL